ncbi:MAG: universal stress protein, partial [Myxococcota bacterium]
MSLHIKNLICGTDFSDSSMGAVHEAIRLTTGRPGARLVMVHVTQKSREAWPALEQRLQQWLEAMPDFGALDPEQVELIIAPGRISQTLGEIASQRADSLIVVGPLRKGLFQQVIGGIAEQLFSVARSPVLATAGPVEHGYHHILVPVDFSLGSSRALQTAASLVRDPHGAVAHGAHLDLIHAYTFPGGVPAGSVRRDLEAISRGLILAS